MHTYIHSALANVLSGLPALIAAAENAHKQLRNGDAKTLQKVLSLAHVCARA